MSRLKIIAIIITFFVLSSVNVTSIFAFDCPDTYQFLFNINDFKQYAPNTAMPQLYQYFTKIGQEEKIDLNKGDSVCSYTKFDEGYLHTENGELGYSAIKKICISGTEYSEEKCKDSQICLYNSQDKKATCENIKGNDGCDTPDEGINTNIVKWPKFTVEGDEVCIYNVRNKCNLYSGNWEPIEDCKKLPCNMFGTQPMKTKCAYTCDNPRANRNDKICSQDGTSVLICEESGWKQKHLSEIWPGQKCEKCLDNPDGTIECLGDGASTCSKIAGDSNKPDEKRPGKKVCNSQKNYLYVCDVNDDNYNGEYFKPEKNCLENTDGRTCCGIKTGASEYDCITEEECDENPQNSITITTTTSDAFWCEKGVSINTAIGCIPITISGENGLVAKLLPTIFGIAGGIAFLMMVYGFILISTSSGDEKKVIAARQIVTSAIIGLLVSLFALFLYRLIAVQILHIPGI